MLGLAKMTDLLKTGLVLLFPFLIRPFLYKQAAVSIFFFFSPPFYIYFLSTRSTLSTFSALISHFDFLILFGYWWGPCGLVFIMFPFFRFTFRLTFYSVVSGGLVFVLWHLVRAGIRGVSGRISLFCFLDWGFIISFSITLGCGGLLFCSYFQLPSRFAMPAVLSAV